MILAVNAFGFDMTFKMGGNVTLMYAVKAEMKLKLSYITNWTLSHKKIWHIKICTQSILIYLYIFFKSLRIKSQSRYSVVAECTVVQLFATVSACVQEFGHRGLAFLFLVPGGHFDKLDGLEWYQDSGEELLIVPLHVVLHTPVCLCTCESLSVACSCILWLCVTASHSGEKTDIYKFLGLLP